MRRVNRRAGTARLAAAACVVSGMACAPAVKNQGVPTVSIPEAPMGADWKQSEGKRVPSCVGYFEYNLAHYKAENAVRNSCYDKFGFENEDCLVEGMMHEYSKEDSELYHYPVSVVLKRGERIPDMFIKGATIDEPDLVMAKVARITDAGVVLQIRGSGICIKGNKGDGPYDLPWDFELTEMIPFGVVASPGFSHMPWRIFSRPCTMWDPTMRLLEWENVRLEKVDGERAVLRYDEKLPPCKGISNQKGSN